MAKTRYEYCAECAIRAAVEERLQVPAYKPPKRGQQETPTAFWSRFEDAGLLSEALALYDHQKAEQAAWAHTRRETKQEFANRLQKEGRQAEAERVWAELLASGLSERDAQRELIARLQPLDGSKTRAWPTPNSWSEGRLFRAKEDQDRLKALAIGGLRRARDFAAAEAQERLRWAQRRSEERGAVAAARKRAKALTAVAP